MGIKMSKHPEYQRLTVRDQSFFCLGSIQGAGIGIPGVMLGGVLERTYGFSAALSSIVIGNLILWVVGLTIISMVSNDRINAIENVKDCLGKAGTIIVSFCLVIMFLDWFAFQINATVALWPKILQFNSDLPSDMVLRIGAALGVFSSLLAIGGIRLLKWISIVSLPFLFSVQIFALFYSGHRLFFSGFVFSWSAIMTTILMFLPGLINLPTFFRHSRSKADSYLGLTVMIICYMFFECTGMWINLNDLFLISIVSVSIFLSIFLILLLLCSNLLNIYLASACYETFIPRFVGTKGHAIMGLLGTVTYTFLQVSAPINFILQLLNAYITSLCVVLLISFLVQVIVHHRPRRVGQVVNTVAWVLGCVIATVLKIQTPSDEIHFLLLGAGASGLFFLVVMYVEETVWAIKKILLEKIVE